MTATRPFLLNSTCPYAVAADGTIWVDRLWARDLVRHFDYLPDLRVLAPRIAREALDDPVPVVPPPGVSLSFADLSVGCSKSQILRNLPRVIATVLAEMRGAGVVQTSPAGWPYAPAFLLLPAAWLFRRPVVTVFESTFWRLPPGIRAGPLPRVRALLTEALARRCVRAARLSVFTSEAYRAEFAAHARGACLVTPASWIDEAQVLPVEAAETSWSGGRAPRLLFAGRLVRDKGVGVLLEALACLDRAGTSCEIAVLGAGEMAADCAAAAGRFGHVRLTLEPPVPYGPAFFERLRTVRAVVVPSLSDEQPRIVYDAFAQATPVLASDTGGLRDAVIPGQTGWRVAPGHAAALAEAIRTCLSAPDEARRLGLAARAVAAGQTHAAMHRARAEALVELGLSPGFAKTDGRAGDPPGPRDHMWIGPSPQASAASRTASE